MADETLVSKLASLIRGKKRTEDIELPNESGRVDPRIEREEVPYDRIAKGYRALQSLGKK